jgi:hypothetical protein
VGKPASVPQPDLILARMPLPALPRRLQPGAVALVLGLHLLLVALLLRLGTWTDRSLPPPTRAPLLLWLPGPGPGPAAQTAAPRPPPSLRAAPVRAPSSRPRASDPADPVAPASPAEPQAITMPAPAPAGVPDAAASEPPRPLNLALPRGAAARGRPDAPALTDARSNTPRATFESRLASALGGDGRWVEERIDTDLVRFRRGGRCVDVQRGRGDQLDPYNRAASLRPWSVGQPKDC